MASEDEDLPHGYDELPPDYERALSQARAGALDAVETLLPTLIARRVPLRALTPGPLVGTLRLRLADSTTLLVGAGEAADMSRVLQALLARRALTLSGWERLGDELYVTVAGVTGSRPPRMPIEGPDQPD